MNTPMMDVEVVRERERAEILMQPLRLTILETARDPGSAADLARRLGLKPQKVNYHVRRLADHGFLRKVEERRAGNVVENVYGATARSYVIASDLLGELSPAGAEAEPGTVLHWFAYHARAERELGTLVERAVRAGQTAEVFARETEFRFETAEQRALFLRALDELFQAVVGKYTTPMRDETGQAGGGLPYRLFLGCFPIAEPVGKAESVEETEPNPE